MGAIHNRWAFGFQRGRIISIKYMSRFCLECQFISGMCYANESFATPAPNLFAPAQIGWITHTEISSRTS